VTTHVIYDEPTDEDLRDKRCDSVGTITRDFLEQRTPYRSASFYFCGPKPFMQSVYSGLVDLGVTEDRIRFEFFGPRQDITTAKTTASN
jgi:nitric oxide dioxygenase